MASKRKTKKDKTKYLQAKYIFRVVYLKSPTMMASSIYNRDEYRLAMMHVNIELLNQLKVTIIYTMSTLMPNYAPAFYALVIEESSFIITITIFLNHNFLLY